MKQMKHYGVNVTIQYRDDFREDLKKAGISYMELPILEPDVLTYEYQGKQMFVIIKPCEESEKVYLASQIPFDMSWENLIRDCDNQDRGAEPMELHTKAYILLQDAVRVAREVKIKEAGGFLFQVAEPTDKEIVTALTLRNGVSVDELMTMDHHDIDDDVLNGLRMA